MLIPAGNMISPRTSWVLYWLLNLIQLQLSSLLPTYFLLLLNMSGIQFVHYVVGAIDSSHCEEKFIPAPEVEVRLPRPQNSWILFRAQKLRDFKHSDPSFRAPQGVISKVVADLWRNASPETKRVYSELAEQKRVEHATMYPAYKFKARPKGVQAKGKTVNLQLPQPLLTNTNLSPPNETYRNTEWLPSDASTTSSASPQSSIFDPSIWTRTAASSFIETSRYNDDVHSSIFSVDHPSLASPSYMSYSEPPPRLGWGFEEPSEVYAYAHLQNVPQHARDVTYFPQHPARYYGDHEEL